MSDTNKYNESAKRKKIQLVVHHIKELEHHQEFVLDENNLESVVCVVCHNIEHGRDFRNIRSQTNGSMMKSGGIDLFNYVNK